MTQQERCLLCFENPDRPKHLVVAIGNLLIFDATAVATCRAWSLLHSHHRYDTHLYQFDRLNRFMLLCIKDEISTLVIIISLFVPIECPTKMWTYGFLLSVLLCLSGVLLSSTVGELCHPDDKKVLLDIKSHFHNAYIFSSWSPDTDCCVDWYIVTCNETTNRIDTLKLFTGGLPPGQIPAAIGDLPYLRELTLHKQPNLTGPIPPAIARLSNLEYLILTWNNLTGPVPSFLGKLEKLIFLELSFNKLSGSIPSSLSNLRKLASLRLDRNMLIGTIPASLSAIRGNNLYLILSHNGLTGKIPESLKDVDFGNVDLSRNMLEGDISMFFGVNNTASAMDFSRNRFEFDMSRLEFQPSLAYLNVDHNRIYGSIPEVTAHLPELRGLNVSYNRLCGRIPVGGNMQNFGYTAYFHNRCLCGPPLNVTCK